MQLDLIPATARVIDVRSGQCLDYQALLRAVAQRSRLLRKEGVGVGSIVAMCHSEGVVLLADLFATWALGATALVLSPSLTAFERNRICAWVKPRCWVGQLESSHIPSVPAELQSMDSAEREVGLSGPPTDSPALLLLTSGSTGAPKGVSLSYRALETRLSSNVAHIGKANLARTLVPLPMHFGHGLIGNTLTPLLAGCDVLLWSEPGVDGLAQLGAVIDEHGVTFLSSVPSMWRIGLKLSAAPHRRTLKRIHVGSEPLPAALWRGICEWAGTKHVYNMYGMTEAANWISGTSAEAAGFVEGAVGRPWSGNCWILLEDGSIAENGEGEILLRDPALMNGYWNDPDSTAAAFHGSWFKTGDIGEISSDGQLRILGRRKHQINRAGIKVTAEEIELLLEQHPEVQDVCAFGLPDAVSGEVVVAAVVTKNGQRISEATIQAWCAERLRREAVPSRIIFLNDIPRNERGKKVRSEVRIKVSALLGREVRL